MIIFPNEIWFKILDKYNLKYNFLFDDCLINLSFTCTKMYKLIKNYCKIKLKRDMLISDKMYEKYYTLLINETVNFENSFLSREKMIEYFITTYRKEQFKENLYITFGITGEYLKNKNSKILCRNDFKYLSLCDELNNYKKNDNSFKNLFILHIMYMDPNTNEYTHLIEDFFKKIPDNSNIIKYMYNNIERSCYNEKKILFIHSYLIFVILGNLIYNH